MDHAIDKKCEATIMLCDNISDIVALKRAVVDGQLRVVLLKTELVYHPDQLLFAIHKSYYSEMHGTMKTRSLVSEIMYNLSPSRNITDSLKTFAISDHDTDAVIILLEGKSNNLGLGLSNFLSGDIVPLDRLPDFRDEEKIKKIYKVPEDFDSEDDLLLSIINRIATKEIV